MCDCCENRFEIFMLMGDREGHGCLLWKDPQEWLENYHMRSISETVNSMVNCQFGAAARGRDSTHGRRLRCGSKLVGHNIRRVRYPEIMGGAVPHWRRGCT